MSTEETINLIKSSLKDNNPIKKVILLLEEKGFNKIQIMSLFVEALGISNEEAQDLVLKNKKDKQSDFLLDLFLDSDSEE